MSAHAYREKLAALKSSDFLRNNAIVFAGSIAISVINYLYYPVLGRLLDPAEFGEVQTLVSLFAQIAIFLSVLGLLTVNIVANHGDKPEAQKTLLELEKFALIISVAGLALAVAGGPFLQNFFNFSSLLPFIGLALAIVVSVPSTFRTAYLRGKQRFGWNSISGLVGAGAKLLLSALFIVMGFGTTGAIAGLVVAQLLTFVYSAAKAKQAGFGPRLSTNFFSKPDMRLLRPEFKYAGLVLMGSLAITALYSIDIVYVKHHFDAHTAGLYAGIATVARIIFFLTGSIALVLLPTVKLSNTIQQNRQSLQKSLYLLIGIGGPALAVFWFLPELVVRLLMGRQYLEYASLLPWLSLVIFIVSVLNLFVLYYMALRRYAIGFIAIAGLLITCVLVGVHHDTLRAVVDSMLYGTLTMTAMIGLWSIKNSIDKNANTH